MAGDIVIGFDNKPVNSFQDLVKFIGTKQPGDVIKLELLRGADNDEMIFLGQLKGQPESDASKDYLDKLRERIGMKIDVTLGEWVRSRNRNSADTRNPEPIDDPDCR